MLSFIPFNLSIFHTWALTGWACLSFYVFHLQTSNTYLFFFFFCYCAFCFFNNEKKCVNKQHMLTLNARFIFSKMRNQHCRTNSSTALIIIDICVSSWAQKFLKSKLSLIHWKKKSVSKFSFFPIMIKIIPMLNSIIQKETEIMRDGKNMHYVSSIIWNK